MKRAIWIFGFLVSAGPVSSQQVAWDPFPNIAGFFVASNEQNPAQNTGSESAGIGDSPSQLQHREAMILQSDQAAPGTIAAIEQQYDSGDHRALIVQSSGQSYATVTQSGTGLGVVETQQLGDHHAVIQQSNEGAQTYSDAVALPARDSGVLSSPGWIENSEGYYSQLRGNSLLLLQGNGTDAGNRADLVQQGSANLMYIEQGSPGTQASNDAILDITQTGDSGSMVLRQQGEDLSMNATQGGLDSSLWVWQAGNLNHVDAEQGDSNWQSDLLIQQQANTLGNSVTAYQQGFGGSISIVQGQYSVLNTVEVEQAPGPLGTAGSVEVIQFGVENVASVTQAAGAFEAHGFIHQSANGIRSSAYMEQTALGVRGGIVQDVPEVSAEIYQ